MSFDIKFKEVGKTQFIDLQKATITDEGLIRLTDGRQYKVELKTADGQLLDKGVGKEGLTQKVLDILKNTGEQFQTLEHLTIRNHSVTHFVDNKETTFQGDENWKKTTTEILHSFTEGLSERVSREKKIEERPPLTMDIQAQHSSKNLSPEKMQRNSIEQLLQKPGSGGPKKLAGQLINKFSDPAINNKIEEFQNKHEKKIATLNNNGGWLKLKKQLGSKMADKQSDPDGQGVSYEQFRKDLNTLTTEIVNTANKKMGIPQIKAGGAGTPGYNSDIDLNMKPLSEKEPLTTGDWTVCRAMANLVSVQILGNMPGPTIDTEWYVDRKFLGEHVKSDGAKSQIATLDLAMGIMQAREGFKSEPKQFEAFKQMQLKNSPKEMVGVKKQLFAQVEKFYEKMEIDIAKEMLGQKGENTALLNEKQIAEKFKNLQNNPDFETDYYNAQVLVQYRAHIELGNQCSELEQLIDAGRKRLETMTPDSKEAELMNSQLDRWIVQHDVLYAMINCTQAEGTMSSSELQTTLDSSGGQIRQRFVEQKQEELGKKLQNLPLSSSPRSRQSLERLKEGAKVLEELDTTVNTKNLGKSHTIPTLLLAGQERVAQFSHKIQEKYDPIDAGKYALRVAESNYFALKLLKEQQGKKAPSNIDSLIKLAGEMYTKSRHLEQCKRGFNLNGVVAKNMLAGQLTVLNGKKQIDLSSLEKIFAKDEIGGDWFEGANKTLMEPGMKLEEMALNLEKKGYISSSQKEILLSSDPQKPEKMDSNAFETLLNVRAILQAKAGFNAALPESGKLRELHNQAKEMTKEHYKLNNENNVKSFATSIESFTLDVQNVMSKAGAMPKFSSTSQETFNFSNLWKSE